MKKGNIFILVILLILFLCSCENFYNISDEEIYGGEVVDLKKIHKRNKNAANKFLNFYLNGENCAPSLWSEHYCYYTYKDTPNSCKPNFSYKSAITIEGSIPHIVAFEFVSEFEAEKMCKTLNIEYWASYKNVIYLETYMAYIIVFGIPKRNNGEYYIYDGTGKVFFGLVQEKYKNADNVKLSSGYKKTYGYSFQQNPNIKRVETNDDLLIIGNSTFYNCRSLEEVVLNEGLKEIGDYAFASCTSLTKINIPSSVKKIHRDAFKGCSALEYIIIPNGVEEIDKNAFLRCSSLEYVVIPNSVLKINNWVFDYGNIYCEVDKKPEGWENHFAYKSAKVYWAGEWEYDDNGVPHPIEKVTSDNITEEV